jgi:outer membrane protein assembly factor BamB
MTLLFQVAREPVAQQSVQSSEGRCIVSNRSCSRWQFPVMAILVLSAWSIAAVPSPAADSPADDQAARLLTRAACPRGICVLIDPTPADMAVAMARKSELTIYVQLPTDAAVEAARAKVGAAGLLGTRIYVEKGLWSKIHLADNLADVVIVAPEAVEAVEPHLPELKRVVNPLGKILLGDREIKKPLPEGVDDWTHHFHGPDNNPQSRDQLARAPYLTQFLGEPWYVPMPGVTVSSAGRVFTAHGHIAFHRRAWPWLNSLVALNGYNGTILWKRSLEPGFMIHRNTLVATPQTVYVADNRSCKLLDAATGRLQGEITAPQGAAGPCWKWMGMEGGVLCALVGEPEPSDPVVRGTRNDGGWPWAPMSQGYDSSDYRWGFGRTFLAVDLKTKLVLWTHTEEKPIDTRAVTMKGGRIYYYSHPEFLACLDAKQGKSAWRSTDPKLLEAIGPHFRAQTWLWGYSSTSYMKCGDKAIYFAGPQRTRLVAASADDGRLLWQHPVGNYQLVLRDEGLFALGSDKPSLLFEPLTGKVLADLICRRAACTRATGTVDSIFTRGESPPNGVGRHAGTMRLPVADKQPRRISLMRPPCQDGVMAANGHLYWGPWMCDCHLSLVGQLCLAPAGDIEMRKAQDGGRGAVHYHDPKEPDPPLQAEPGDWPTYRADNQRSAASAAKIPDKVNIAWQYQPPRPDYPAAPVTAGGLVFLSGGDGVVRAVKAATGKVRWSAYTGGRIYYPPALHADRLFVGSGDGYVYAFEAYTGRLRWRVGVAPTDRKIAEHGRLISTWPVASGVIAERGAVYAAAGLASWDGTYVVAINAKTGGWLWANEKSGHLAEGDRTSGVSVQGHLLLTDGKLYLAGGNVVSPAVYDVKDGRCLNALPDEWAFAPRGSELVLAGGQVGVFGTLLYSPYEPGLGPYRLPQLLQAQSGPVVVRSTGGPVMRIDPAGAATPQPKTLWVSKHLAAAVAVALGDGAVVAAGQVAESDPSAKPSYAVAALATDDGRVLWSQPLPAVPRTWGIALDAAGRVVVAMQDGRVMCLAGAE